MKLIPSDWISARDGAHDIHDVLVGRRVAKRLENGRQIIGHGHGSDGHDTQYRARTSRGPSLKMEFRGSRDWYRVDELQLREPIPSFRCAGTVRSLHNAMPVIRRVGGRINRQCNGRDR